MKICPPITDKILFKTFPPAFWS